MAKNPSKRYAHTLLYHFVIIGLFLPTFYSQYIHMYYQDLFLTNILALFFILNVFRYHRLDFKSNLHCTILMTTILLVYNFVCFYNYKHNPDFVFWRTEQFNITVAFLFFITLILIKEKKKIISDKTIKFIIYSILIHTLFGFVYRAMGYQRFYMMHLTYDALPIDLDNPAFSWVYYSPAEYGLILLLCMAFFMVYQKQFHNLCFYGIGQIILLIALYLTNTPWLYVSGLILIVSEIIHCVLEYFKVPHKFIYISFPVVLGILIKVFTSLTKTNTWLYDKTLLWEGHWDMLQDSPLGILVAFGPLEYNIWTFEEPVTQASNVIINHMLRHGLGVGLLYALLFVALFIFAFLKKPNYRSFGLLIALLFPFNFDFGLQVLHLPFVLFMFFCIFFRENVSDRKGV